MKRWYAPLFYAWCAAAITVSAAAAAQPAHSRLLLPHVANGAVVDSVATTCDGQAPILDQDTGSLSAMRDADGRYIIAYQDRAHGSLAHVAQHVGSHLEDVALPPSFLAAPRLPDGPNFSPSGVKQGSLALVPNVSGGRSRLYYTQRKPGDETGPYGVWCMEF